MIDERCWPLVDASRMRALDRYSIDKLGIGGELLMESAGQAVVRTLLERFGGLLRDGEVCVVCGAGNNGGDGFVVARQLALMGVPVRVALLAEPGALGGDAAANFERLGPVGVAVEGADWQPPRRGVVVDAIFGTGLGREVGGRFAESVRRINGSRRAGDVAVLSVDVPSGLCSDTGQVLGVCVHADVTVTIALPKVGLALEPGRSAAGEIRVARIGIADGLPEDRSDLAGDWGAHVWQSAERALIPTHALVLAGAQAALVTRRGAAEVLPRRPTFGHKGSFGHVLVAAGSVGKTGAAALAARGAGRMGAGLVTIACPESLNDILEGKCTEAMTVPVPEVEGRCFGEVSLARLHALARERDVVALGPGIGRAPETESMVRALLPELDVPVVLDADGLNAFEGKASELTHRKAATVLTPHPGEAARLLGVTTPEINADRVASARRLAAQSGAVVLLKGAASVVADPSGRVLINATGGPELATGGTGDVLTGLVAALLAQGCAPLLAAALAAWLHGAAGDALAAEGRSSGLLATDLADAIPSLCAQLRREVEDGSAAPDIAIGTLLPFP